MQGQFDAVSRLIESSTNDSVTRFNVVEEPANLNSSADVFQSPYENGEEGYRALWAIGGVTKAGFVLPANELDVFFGRPDQATNDVAKFVEIKDGLGDNLARGYEESADRWFPVTRDSSGRLQATYNVEAGKWQYFGSSIAENVSPPEGLNLVELPARVVAKLVDGVVAEVEEGQIVVAVDPATGRYVSDFRNGQW